MTVGVDEVGRGCWAGPLVAGAVVLDITPIPGIHDSKLLSRNQREALDPIIRLQAVSYGLGWVTPKEIDEIGLTHAVGLAMRRAIEVLTVEYNELIIDGSYNFFPDDPRSRAIIKADQTIPAVSAASIIAKVARDHWMANKAAKDYPQYGFESHVGYGTAVHRSALAQYGVTPLHRRSYKPVQAFL